MAKPKTKTGAIAGLNLTLLAAIVTATSSAAGFMNAPVDQAQPLATAGYIEINGDTSLYDADGSPAVRATDAGIAFSAANPAPVEGEDDVAGSGTEATAPAVVKQSVFTIAAAVEMPDSARTGRTGKGAYPFDDLELNQSFFVAATTDKPNPAKSMASTVTGANDRYSVEIDGTRVTRTGKTVSNTKPERLFAIRPVGDGAPWGQPGVKGAGIWRTL